MSEENKCVGLDCEMCGYTKCPNEEKEKIINGIDVSECEHHYTNTVNGIMYNGCAIYEQINELGYSQDTLCEQNPDCYFKQFKRLQKENESLKSLNDFNVQKIEVLKEENEKLHRHCQICENFIDGIPCKPLRDMDYDLQKVISQRDKYIQALEEIREKCLKMCNICDNIDGETYLDDCNSICEYCKIVKLIMKIRIY